MNAIRNTALALAAILAIGMSSPATAAESESMQRLHIMLLKLKDASASLKDMDKLEQAGMEHRQVERMRQAMRRKIQQMIDETIRQIQQL